MKYVNFFGNTISKLIVGDNPFTGHSYIEDVAGKQDMLRYYTAENIKATLREIEAQGITTMLPLADPYIVRILQEYEYEGGNLKYIWQPYMSMRQDVSMKSLKALKGTIGIYHQGTTTDRLYKQGEIQQIKDNIKMWREGLEVPVGLASHQPKVIEQCEEEDWGAEFYLASLHNGDRWRNGEQSGFITGETKAHLIFSHLDRPIMLETLSKFEKPILAYKIFAGGQLLMNKTEEEVRAKIKDTYEEVFSKLKPDDAAVMGVWQRDKNQVKENVELFNQWATERKI